MLTRIRNGLLVRKKTVVIPYSKLKEGLAKNLKRLGFILDYSVESIDEHKKQIVAHLKYVNREPAIIGIIRQSKPGCRIFTKAKRFRVGGCPQHSVSILTTSNGILSDREAREQGVGGEVLCTVW